MTSGRGDGIIRNPRTALRTLSETLSLLLPRDMPTAGVRKVRERDLKKGNFFNILKNISPIALSDVVCNVMWRNYLETYTINRRG